MKELFKPTLLAAIVFTLIIALCLIFCGCGKQYYDNRNVQRLESYMPRYQPQASKLANQLWPCNQVFHTDTVTTFGPPDVVYKKGDSTVIIRNDTVRITYHDTVFKTKIKTKTVTDSVKSDNRALAACQLNSDQANKDKTVAQTQLADANKSKKTWMWIAIGCMTVIVISVVVWVYKTFFAGGAGVSLLKKL